MASPQQLEKAQLLEDAEIAVLGSILIDPDCLPKLRRLLDPDDFKRPRHGWIYQAMLRIANRGVGGDPQVRSINEITLAYELSLEPVPERQFGSEQQNPKDWPKTMLGLVGGAAYLAYLVAQCPTSIFAEDYARVIRDASGKGPKQATIETERVYQGKGNKKPPRREETGFGF